MSAQPVNICGERQKNMIMHIPNSKITFWKENKSFNEEIIKDAYHELVEYVQTERFGRRANN